jgi:hypothetical protein
MSKQIGYFYPEFGGYYIGSLNFNYRIADYFITEKQNQIILPWGSLGQEIGICLSHYTDSQHLNILTNEKTNSSYNGSWNTSNFLYTKMTPAGLYCYELFPHYFQDFFLPSLHELYMIYKNLDVFTANCPENESLELSSYWSSSEHNSWKSWIVDFCTGRIHCSNKHESHIVLPVRKFIRYIHPNI